jgi:hypothetical protein
LAFKNTRPIESIEGDERFKAASSILRTLEHGLTAIEAEADALRIEEHLKRQPANARAGDKRRNSRNADLQARLDKHHAKVPAKAAEEPTPGGLPATISAALEIIRGGLALRGPAIKPATRVDLKTLIEQFQNDQDAIRAAIFIQAPIVDGIRNELIAAQSMSDREAWQAIQLRKFRALQIVAALKDEEDEFRRNRVDGGFTPWRSDLLPSIATRPMLIVGSERDWDSEISRARRFLEESKVL